MTTRRSLLLAAASQGLILPLAARAQATDASAADFPNRPIRIVVPYAPGASNDGIARLVATHLQESLKQPVVVENRTGAGGDIGTAYVAKSKADGYTLLMTSNAAGVSSATKRKPAFDMLADLQPLVMVGSQPMLLVAAPNLGFSSLTQFFAAAKAEPSKFSYGTPGMGTPHHLTFELISSSRGLKMIHVPFAGTAQVLNEVMADRVSLTLGTQASAGGLVQQGRVKLVGVVAPKRLKEYPNVPTLIESGVPELESGFWYGFTAPTGLPPSVAAKLNSAISAALAQPAVAEKISKMDIDANNLQGAEFGRFIATDYRRWKNVSQKADLLIE